MPHSLLRLFICLNCLLTGAHFLHAGEQGLAIACAGLGLGAFCRADWLRPVLAVFFLASSIVWTDAGAELVRFRATAGLPWTRLLFIMACLCASALAAAATLCTSLGKKAFPLVTAHGRLRSLVFLGIAALLLIARSKTPFPILLADRYPTGNSGGSGWGGLEIFCLALYGQWLAARLINPTRRPGTRGLRPIIWAGFSAVFFVQLFLGLAGMEQMLMTGKLHLPVPALIVAGPLYRGGGLFMPILLGVSVLLLGPAWCSHLCYIGAWDDLASRHQRSPRTPSSGLIRLIKWSRLVILVLVCATALGLRAAGVPGTTAIWPAAIFGLIGLGVMFFLSRRWGFMAHCTLFCPIGWLTTTLGRISPWRMDMGQDCTRCGACSRACRYAALTPDAILRGKPGPTCTLCGDCVAACPHSTMHYTLYGRCASIARPVFVGLVVILHAVFLATARI